MRYYEVEVTNKFAIEAESAEEALELFSDGTHLDRTERVVFVGAEQDPAKIHN